MLSDATTVDASFAALPPDRRSAVEAVRQVILASVADGYEEVMEYGMISYVVPPARHPETYTGKPLTTGKR